MRRPLPPELVELGDHLELAVRRSLARRPARRQQFLNAATGLLVALPLIPAVLGAVSPARVQVAPPAAVATADRPSSFGGGNDDFPPRALRGPDVPSEDVLAEPSTLRRALR